MYHQVKQLADVDITTTAMEVGPTMHYIMGGVRVDPETQMSTVPGLFAAGECAAGLHGANRLGGNSLSDLLVFGRRAGLAAAHFAKENGLGRIQEDAVCEAERRALEPFERGGSGSTSRSTSGAAADAAMSAPIGPSHKGGPESESPYRVQRDLQSIMQDLVGIVREEK